VSITHLLPVRLGVLRPTRQPKHRATDEVDRLRLKLGWADSLIKTQRVQLDDAARKQADIAAKQAAAEELVVKLQADVDDLTVERDEWRDDALALRARFAGQLAAEANANRITVPPMIRDATAIEDQATGPIPVKALWEAHGVRPVTDPGRTH
jgi:hypothetical protein